VRRSGHQFAIAQFGGGNPGGPQIIVQIGFLIRQIQPEPFLKNPVVRVAQGAVRQFAPAYLNQ